MIFDLWTRITDVSIEGAIYMCSISFVLLLNGIYQNIYIGRLKKAIQANDTRISRRLTYRCRSCGNKFQVDTFNPLPEPLRLCTTCLCHGYENKGDSPANTFPLKNPPSKE